MQHRNNKLAGPKCRAARDEELVAYAAAARDASALARLLIYATADARELGSEDAARQIEEAVESVKRTFALTDADILPTAPFLNH